MGKLLTRDALASLIVARLDACRAVASGQYSRHRYFIVDDLLPFEIAQEIHQSFPPTSLLMLRRSMREVKFVTAQMDRCEPLLEESIFAFQDERVVELIGHITGIASIEPDQRLYAGGISIMGRGHYLNPHLDNSHDMGRNRYRVLNLLYYTTPNWAETYGGNFELWPNGLTAPVTIHSKFNRLLVLGTNRSSWHSVSRVNVDGLRTCVSNYYFSPLSPEREEYSHVTSFRARPGQPLLDFVLRADSLARTWVRKVVKDGLVRTKHFYERGKTR